MLPLPFAVCARPCATNAVLCTRDGQRFLPFARAPIELLPPHAFLNPTECEIECSNHRPRRLGEFRLMNAGDRRGPLGSHSFILGTLLGLQARILRCQSVSRAVIQLKFGQGRRLSEDAEVRRKLKFGARRLSEDN